MSYTIRTINGFGKISEFTTNKLSLRAAEKEAEKLVKDGAVYAEVLNNDIVAGRCTRSDSGRHKWQWFDKGDK